MKINIALLVHNIFQANWLGLSRQFTGAVQGATKQASKEIESAIGDAVAHSGKFGAKWTQGIHATIIQGNGFNSTIQVQSSIPFFSVFDKGVTIKGNPFLWLPLSFSDAAGQKVSSFKGQLFFVKRKVGGPPLLLSIATKKPMFVGLTSVTLKKKWDTAQIVKAVMSRFADFIKGGL
jgi:hypothetical protein